MPNEEVAILKNGLGTGIGGLFSDLFVLVKQN